METSEPSPLPTGLAKSTSSPEASPARTSAQQVRAPGSREHAAACGSKCSGWSATFDRDTCSWRTVPCSDHAGSTSSSVDLPASGLMQRGRLFPRKTSAHHTSGSGCGFSLPTPTASSYGTNQGGAAGRVGPVRHSLASMARHGTWPTPTANDSKNKLWTRCGKTGRLQETLLSIARWPTPAARDYRSGSGHQERGHTPQLCEAVGGTLNPSWVEWLMGLPIGWTGSVLLGTHRSPSKQPPPSDDSWPL